MTEKKFHLALYDEKGEVMTWSVAWMKASNDLISYDLSRHEMQAELMADIIALIRDEEKIL